MKKGNANYQVSLKVLLRNRKGEMLLLKSPATSVMPKHYDLPGGRILESEKMGPFRKMIRRELREEIGPDVKYKLKEVPVAIGRHYYALKKKPGRRYIFWVLFEAEYRGGEITISDEHISYEWTRVSRKNCKKYFIRGPLELMANYLSGRFPG